MSWHTLDPRIRTIAVEVLTDLQLHAWRLELAGLGTRAIALHTDTARSTIRDRLTEAHRRLRHAGVQQHSNGIYYLEEAA